MIHFAVYLKLTTFKINYISTKIKNIYINKNKTKKPQKIKKIDKTKLCKVICLGRHIRKDKKGWLMDDSVRKMAWDRTWHGVFEVRHSMPWCGMTWAVLCCIVAWHDRAGCMGEQDMVWCVGWACFQCGILWLKSHRCERRSISIKLLTFNKSLNSQETSFSICKRKITKTNIQIACLCVCVCVCVCVCTHAHTQLCPALQPHGQ